MTIGIRTYRVFLVAILLGAFSLKTSAEEAAAWPDERTIGPFRIHANFSLDEFGPVLQDLALLPADVGEILAVAPPGEVIHVYLFDRRSIYEDYIEQYFPDLPNRRALYIKERGPGMVFAYLSSELETDLRHECTHAVLHASLPMVPLWLDEGIAEYFEVPRGDRGENSPHLSTVRWRCRLGLPPDIEQLEELGDLASMTRGNYRDAWAWVHFMIHGEAAAREELQRFLADIAARTPPGDLSRRLAVRLTDRDRQFSRHIRDW